MKKWYTQKLMRKRTSEEIILENYKTRGDVCTYAEGKKKQNKTHTIKRS